MCLYMTDISVLLRPSKAYLFLLLWKKNEEDGNSKFTLSANEINLYRANSSLNVRDETLFYTHMLSLPYMFCQNKQTIAQFTTVMVSVHHNVLPYFVRSPFTYNELFTLKQSYLILSIVNTKLHVVAVVYINQNIGTKLWQECLRYASLLIKNCIWTNYINKNEWQFQDIEKKAKEVVLESYERALASPDPSPEDLFTHDFAPTPITEERGNRRWMIEKIVANNWRRNHW